MEVRRIIIHHSADDSATFEGLMRYWHGTFHYHYFIDKNGIVSQGLSDEEVGEHVAWKNTGSLGICMNGDYSVGKPPKKQLKAMDKLIEKKLKEHRDCEEVQPHNHYNETICPGDFLTGYIIRNYQIS